MWGLLVLAAVLHVAVPHHTIPTGSWWLNWHTEALGLHALDHDALLLPGAGDGAISSALWSLRWEVLFSALLPALLGLALWLRRGAPVGARRHAPAALAAALCLAALARGEIAKARWPADPAAHAYEAARVAAETRAHLIARGRPFIAETVFSHPSKLELIRTAQAASYHVVLHAMLAPEELAVRRVAYRVRAGGHDVPEHKIRERYQRLWRLVAQAVSLADRAVVYDNSRLAGPVKVAEFFGGLPMGVGAWPGWAPQPMLSRWGD